MHRGQAAQDSMTARRVLAASEPTRTMTYIGINHEQTKFRTYRQVAPGTPRLCSS
jgi:hypothetical protein